MSSPGTPTDPPKHPGRPPDTVPEMAPEIAPEIAPGIAPGGPTDRSAPFPDPTLPGTIRFLRWMTGLLTATMIFGLIAIVALLVTRWPVPVPAGAGPGGDRAASTGLSGLVPDGGVRLPAGVTADALTLGSGWAIVVTADGSVIAFDPASGEILNRMRLRP